MKIGSNDIKRAYFGSTSLSASNAFLGVYKVITENLLTLTSTSASTVLLSNVGGNTPNVEYSLNEGTWTSWDYSEISLSDGDVIRFKGVNSSGFSTSESVYSQFVMTGSLEASGSVMGLIDGVGSANTIPNSYCFYSLFANCSALTSVSNYLLSARTLSNYCYKNMFADCTSLTSAPRLSSTTLAEGCYDNMFNGCTSLTTAPSLPATTLAESCYFGMFKGCTSLTTAPVLNATTLVSDCYNSMFGDCTNLNYATVLADASELTSSNVTNMFLNVATSGTLKCLTNAVYTNLVNNADLPSTWNCVAEYDYLTFISSGSSGISMSNIGGNTPNVEYSLNSGTWTTWDYSNISLSDGDVIKFRGVNATGFSHNSVYSQFVMTGSLAASGSVMSLIDGQEISTTTIPSGQMCFKSLFENCTALTSAPKLTATNTQHTCYVSMFKGCTSLTTAPDLNADSAAEGAYQYMFEGCSSLNYVKCLSSTFYTGSGTFDIYWVCYNWMSEVASTGTFVKNSSVPSGNFGYVVPGNWTIQDA